jgi:hypothetical protein
MRLAPHALLVLLLLVGGAAVLLSRPTAAEEGPYELRYLGISGDGSNAKAWYEGAPPSGARIQEALDRFAKEGFRFAALTPTWRQAQLNVSTATSAPPPATIPEPTFVMILEKRR